MTAILDMSPADRYLSAPQRYDVELHMGFNVKTPAGNLWRVLWRERGNVNLLDPQGRGRTMFLVDPILNYDKATADNALAMLLVLQSPVVPTRLVRLAPAFGEYSSCRSGEDFVECTACCENVECTVCCDDPPSLFINQYSDAVQALYEP